MEETERIPIYTIGYGNRTITQFIDILNQYQIAFVIDVRSKPYSRFNPDYTKDALEKHLREHTIRYVFMGDTLGGQPSDKTCYREDDKADEAGEDEIEDKGGGKKLIVDYKKLREKPFFQEGIARLHTAWKKQLKVAVMCSELKPEKCHRSKLIGNTLIEMDIAVAHIDESGNWKDQQAVNKIIAPESDIQQSLFVIAPLENKKMNRSEKKH